MKIDIFGTSVDPVVVGACIVVGMVSLKLLRRYFEGGWCYSKARLDGKTVIITGANTGIGKETAKDLAGRGARVVIACRDTDKAEQAIADIRKTTGSNKLVVYKLDLASFASIRECATTIIEKESRLDILICNAGIMFCPEWKTADGFEMQFGVNHLGHFLFTNLLLDLIKASVPSRIVVVASIGHRWFGKMMWDDLNLRKGYETKLAYGQSKLSNILFVKELSKRLKGTGVTANALHPGNVMTELTRHSMSALPPSWQFITWMSNTFMGRFMQKTPVQGAQTTINCAVAEELKDTTGLYFADCAPRTPSKAAQDPESARRLWEVSAEMVGLDKKLK